MDAIQEGSGGDGIGILRSVTIRRAVGPVKLDPETVPVA
jgi:hypothetical protein